MNKQRIPAKVIALLLSILMIVSVLPLAAFAVAELDESAFPDDTYLVSKTQYTVAPGIEETHFITNNAEGTNQNMAFAFTVEMGGSASIIASYKDQDGSVLGLQSVRDQAASAEQKRGYSVVGGINGNTFNMQTGATRGHLILDGKEYNSGEGYPYFAVLKDGTATIREAGVPTDDVKEAIGIWAICIKDGVNITSQVKKAHTDIQPRTAIGIKADGSVVLIVLDGRQSPTSTGMTWSDVCDLMISMGVVLGGHLDGGGSSTFISQHEGESGLVCRNSPSDGVERAVCSSLLITSSAKPTGVFDHAALTPNNELYTPGSSVQFVATGVDAGGSSAALPADGSFVLADDSFGTITSDGLFESSGKLGTVVVNYVSGGAVCGSVSIEIAIPDELYIPSDEVSLGYDQTTDFGIVAKCQNRVVNMKAGDLIWSVVDEEGNDASGLAGTFDGLTFTTVDDDTMINVFATAKLSFDESVSASLKVIVGAKPVVLYDMEYTTDAEEAEANPDLKYIPSTVMPKYDNEVYESSAAQAAVEYENGYPFLTWPNQAFNYGKEYMTAEIVSAADNEPVRFGEHSMKITFDLSAYNNASNGNFYLRTTVPDTEYGSPTAIGAWIYVPEGLTSALHLYLQVANNTYSTVYGSVGSTNQWSGWKYVRLDLTDPNAGYHTGTQNAPFTTYQGNGIFWISYQPGTSGIISTAASIYLDNIQLVYGANTDDVDNPVILSIGTEETDFVDGETVLTSNINTFKSTFSDFDGKYKTDIDYEKTKMAIDGIDVTDRCFVNEGGGEVYLYDAELANGTHNISITVADNFGNQTTETRYFKVAGSSSYAELSFVGGADPILGYDYEIVVSADAIADIMSADLRVGIASDYTKYWKDYEVVPGANYALDGDASYDILKESIVFKAVRNAEATAEDDFIAKIVIHIPTDMPEGLTGTYRISKAELTYASDRPTGFINGSASDKVTTQAVSPYIITVDPMIVKSTGSNIYVKDPDGNPVEGAIIYNNSNGKNLGTTDADGVLFNKTFVSKAQKYKIYAEKDGFRSFIYSDQTYPNGPGGNTYGTPYYVKLNATENPATSQSISWMSSALKSAATPVAKYAEKAVYEVNGEETEWLTCEGTSQLTLMVCSTTASKNYAARLNSVLIEGLKPDTEYVYIVGDGTLESDVKNFTTSRENTDVNFFVLGDTQATDTTNTDEITKNLAASGVNFDFGIQTGDAIDNGANYADWKAIAAIFSGEFLGEQDLVQVLGNHESYGDATAHNAAAYYRLPETPESGEAPACYSVQYGNVYVAVINYSDNMDGYRQAAEWVLADAQNATANWKVLTMHQPAYPTNPSGSNPAIKEIVTELVDAADFDVVFSGHDHSYARTAPLTDGAVDTANGATYYICGSTGEKSYEIVDNADHHYAVLNGDYNAIYLTVSTTDTQMVINTHEYTADGEDVIIDSYTINKAITCSENGEHVWTLNGDCLTCAVCKYTRPVNNYTGFVLDPETGNKMYLYLGNIRTAAWLSVNYDIYYLDENGYVVTGKYTVTEALKLARDLNDYSGPEFLFNGEPTPIEYAFDEDGKLIQGTVISQNGAKYCIYAGVIQFGWYQIDGDWYMFDGVKKKDMYGKMLTGVWERNYMRYECDSEGKLIKGAVTEDGGTKYFWADNYVTGWQTVDGLYYNSNKTLKGLRYFDPESGYMAVNTTLVIDGVEHTFDENGVCSCSVCKPESPTPGAKNLLARILDFFKMILNLLQQLFNGSK